MGLLALIFVTAGLCILIFKIRNAFRVQRHRMSVDSTVSVQRCLGEQDIADHQAIKTQKSSRRGSNYC